MRTFIPFGDRVLIKPITTAVKTTGLATPQSQKEVPTEGIVVAAGPRASSYGADGDYNPDGVTVGEHVAYTKYAGREEMHAGEKHLLLRLEELVGRITDTPE